MSLIFDLTVFFYFALAQICALNPNLLHEQGFAVITAAAACWAYGLIDAAVDYTPGNPDLIFAWAVHCLLQLPVVTLFVTAETDDQLGNQSPTHSLILVSLLPATCSHWSSSLWPFPSA
jgi:hypothetical protein